MPIHKHFFMSNHILILLKINPAPCVYSQLVSSISQVWIQKLFNFVVRTKHLKINIFNINDINRFPYGKFLCL